MPSYHINSITKQTFEEVLSRYPSAAPEKLHDLDAQRYEAIPEAIAKPGGREHLTKDEVVTLVEWKLKHGTFRPKLLQLVQSNDAPTIEESTKSAFSSLAQASYDKRKAFLAPLKILTNALKGIGPATASLLLSVRNPELVPFFSDELFRWCTWDEGDGWNTKIKYNVKEYEELCEKVSVLRERLGVRCVDAEKVAWVLGREGVDCGDEESVGEKGDMEEEVEKPKKVETKGTKRKTLDVKPPAEGTRKSARTKK